MDRRTLLFRLLLGSFALVMIAFLIRGTGSLFLGSEASTRIAGPVFLLALGTAAVGFVLAVGFKLQELRSGGDDPVGR